MSGLLNKLKSNKNAHQFPVDRHAFAAQKLFFARTLRNTSDGMYFKSVVKNINSGRYSLFPIVMDASVYPRFSECLLIEHSVFRAFCGSTDFDIGFVNCIAIIDNLLHGNQQALEPVFITLQKLGFIRTVENCDLNRDIIFVRKQISHHIIRSITIQ